MTAQLDRLVAAARAVCDAAMCDGDEDRARDELYSALVAYDAGRPRDAQKDLFSEDDLEAPKPKRRVIHVDQGRRATNIVNKVDNPIIRMDNERGDPLAWGGTLTMVCHCGRATCRFVQPKPDRAYVVVEDHVLIIDDEDKREE